jgi:adenine-specific DNA-methyltransferase
MATTQDLKTKFTNLLKSMFQLDQPELDFGLYKIMHSKADRINAFLDKELAQQIDAVFADADQADQSQQIEVAKQVLIGQLGEEAFGDNGELVEHFKTVPAAKTYLQTVAQAKSGKGNLSERAMIYDHLIRFFSRYYDGGDFMSRRYHVAENRSRASAYAVPYDGSEVYLHWANKDQYYIKTTESFNQYSFDIAEAAIKQAEQVQKQNKAGTLDLEAAPQLATKRIHFKLMDVAPGEHNNNKESEKRQFFIRAEQPVALNEAGELEVYFEFRVAGKNDAISAEQEKQLKSRFGASNKGDLPNLHITQVIQDALLAMQEQPGLIDFVKFVQILAPTDKIKQRPLLTKYLNNYTSKNTMDYFIHKDLGGFLQRELDFYIKNEIMRLDDIEQADEGDYARLLQKIRTLRGVAKEIIQFLAQLEDFQKKLWLKKKFVTETQYCITLDRLQNQPGLVKIALDNEKQRQEWVSLFAIDLNELDNLKEHDIEAVLANEKYRYLVLDTQFFDAGFKDELLAEIEGLDEQNNGLLINSDNFQALNVVKESFQSEIKCIYIDPPYNAQSSEILYKNTFKHSSWISMMENRLSKSRLFLKPNGIKVIAIDEIENNNLALLIKTVFHGYEDTTVSVVHNPTGQQGKNFSFTHEFAHFIYPKGLDCIGLEDRDDENRESKPDVRPLRNVSSGKNHLRESGANCFYPIYVKDGEIVGFGDVCNKDFHPNNINLEEPDGSISIYPIDPSGVESKWVFARDSVETILNELSVEYNSTKGHWDISRRKVRFRHKSNWSDKRYSANSWGSVVLNNMMPGNPFTYPKSIYNVRDCVDAGLSNQQNGFVLDYFAGSGTTGHAVINLNREDQGNRKYILCEMGTYFDSVTKPRIQKVVYAKDWKDGKPVFDKDSKTGGVSQCFKYLRLEQYEDTLNNLIDSRTYEPDSVPKDFILSYLLEAETAESPSLLNLQQFSQPRNYQLQIKRPNSDQSTLQTIDLVETFNWLIGLNVVKLDKWRAYDCEFEREHDPELPNDQHTRLKVKGKLKQADAYAEGAPVYQIRTVEGWVRRQPGNDELRDTVLVIWRNLSDDPEKDSAVLEALLEKLAINQADSQFDKIYINGPHGLQLHGSAKTRLLSLEDTFMTKMWEGA